MKEYTFVTLDVNIKLNITSAENESNRKHCKYFKYFLFIGCDKIKMFFFTVNYFDKKAMLSLIHPGGAIVN